jgi:hypothetical protein
MLHPLTASWRYAPDHRQCHRVVLLRLGLPPRPSALVLIVQPLALALSRFGLVSFEPLAGALS